jgi:transposase
MITGDHAVTAAAIAAQIGLDDTLAEGEIPKALSGHELEAMSDAELGEQLDRMRAHYEQELKKPELHSIKEKVLTSLKNHWPGLTVFVDHPAVLMDNNKAERSVRGPVTGRKNYYGSGSRWSAELAATMFTVLQTILLWGINPKHWLQLFLQACADNGGQTPADLSPFLPWQMSEQRRQQLFLPLPADDVAIIRAETTEPECIDSS